MYYKRRYISFNKFFKVNAPFKPEISGITDVQNFDEEFTTEEVAQSMIPEKSIELIKKNQEKFKDFK
jgi:hypothetical protein